MIFERNPLTTHVLRSSVGYTYGHCARKLFYQAEANEVQVSQEQEEAFENGRKQHQKVQREKYPGFLHEETVSRDIPEVLGVSKVSATFDCLSQSYEKAVEIKPRYSFGKNSMPAYCQTLIQRFVLPSTTIYCYSYLQDQEFPLKADYDMSKVYIGRILTALHHKPPRVPHAQKDKFPCDRCSFRERCYSEEETTWEEFKVLSTSVIEKIRLL